MKPYALMVVLGSAFLVAACGSAPDGANHLLSFETDAPDASGSGKELDSGVSATDSGRATSPQDGGAGKTYVDSSAPGFCPTPADVSGFTPGAMPSPRVDKTACTSNDYQAYYNACFGPNSSQSACGAWSQAHMKCLACIESNASDPQWGVIVHKGGVSSANVAGCLKLVGESSCSAAYSNQGQCLSAACDLRCPVTNTASFNLYEKCVANAQAGGCKSWVDATATACDVKVAPNETKCEAVDFASLIVKIGPVFCGP